MAALGWLINLGFAGGTSGVEVSATSQALALAAYTANVNAETNVQATSASLEIAYSTNLLTYSEQIDNAAWSERVGTSLVITANDATAPDGTLTADKVENLGVLGVDDTWQVVSGLSTSSRYEPSFYIKKITGTGTLYLKNPADSGYGFWTIDLSLVGSGWERITRDHAAVTITNEFSAPSGSSGHHYHASAGSLDFYFWGGQLDAGTASTFYKKTEASAVRVNSQATVSLSASVPAPAPSGGAGRYIGYLPEAPKRKKKKVLDVQWTDDHDKELQSLLKKADEDYEQKRAAQFDALMDLLRQALNVSQSISLSGFQYLTEQDMKEAKRKIQQEEEAIILLMML